MLVVAIQIIISRKLNTAPVLLQVTSIVITIFLIDMLAYS